jgi:hypothetical protein
VSTAEMLKVLSIEELTTEQEQKCRLHLSSLLGDGPIKDIFWLLIPEKYLTKTQINILQTHGPFKIAIEIINNKIRFELLVRSEYLYNIGGGDLTYNQFKYINRFYNKLYNYLLKK